VKKALASKDFVPRPHHSSVIGTLTCPGSVAVILPSYACDIKVGGYSSHLNTCTSERSRTV